MSVTLQLKPEVQQRIAAEAKARGLSVEEYLQQELESPHESANQRFATPFGDLDMLTAEIDPLTETLNYRTFHSLLARVEGHTTSETNGSVALIDIDDLKNINDQFGHTIGDKAIRAVADALRLLLRPDDMLFRLGSNEFLVLVFNLSEERAARQMESLNGILHIAGSASSKISISISTAVSEFASLKELPDAIKRAERSLYVKKNTARKSAETDPNLLPFNEWLRRWNEWLNSHDYIVAPPLSDEAISRESIYREREDEQL